MKTKLQYHRHDHLKYITFSRKRASVRKRGRVEPTNSILWIFAVPLEKMCDHSVWIVALITKCDRKKKRKDKWKCICWKLPNILFRYRQQNIPDTFGLVWSTQWTWNQITHLVRHINLKVLFSYSPSSTAHRCSSHACYTLMKSRRKAQKLR